MKRILAVVWLLLLLPGALYGEDQVFTVDYWGFPIKFECAVRAREAAADDFVDLVERDKEEVADCARALFKAADKYRIEGYAQVLLLARFAEGLAPNTRQQNLASFAEAAGNQTPLSRNDRIALLYALLSFTKFGIEVKTAQGVYFLLLRANVELSGAQPWGDRENYYVWEPVRPFTDIGLVEKIDSAANVLFRNGAPVTFHDLPKIPWAETERGAEVRFRSPEGCPAAWNFKVNRLPEYETYLELWPRDREVLFCLARPMLEPFPFAKVFTQGAEPYDEQELGTCLLQWVMTNAAYDEEHAADENKMARNPVETLMVYQAGVCSELSYTLIAVLEFAGFPPENIIVLRWRPDTPQAHMNLAVAPREGDLTRGAYFEFDGRRYYLMDPAYHVTDQQKLATQWGDVPDRYQGQRAISYRLECP